MPLTEMVVGSNSLATTQDENADATFTHDLGSSNCILFRVAKLSAVSYLGPAGLLANGRSRNGFTGEAPRSPLRGARPPGEGGEAQNSSSLRLHLHRGGQSPSLLLLPSPKFPSCARRPEDAVGAGTGRLDGGGGGTDAGLER